MLATSVLERVELVADRWDPRTADVADVEELAVVVAALQADFAAHVSTASVVTDEEVVALRETRDGVARALRIVCVLLEEASGWT